MNAWMNQQLMDVEPAIPDLFKLCVPVDTESTVRVLAVGSKAREM